MTLDDVAGLFTVPEAAAALGISTRTLADLTERGEVRRVKLGGKVRYERNELEQYVKRQAQQ